MITVHIAFLDPDFGYMCWPYPFIDEEAVWDFTVDMSDTTFDIFMSFTIE